MTLVVCIFDIALAYRLRNQLCHIFPKVKAWLGLA